MAPTRTRWPAAEDRKATQRCMLCGDGCTVASPVNNVYNVLCDRLCAPVSSRTDQPDPPNQQALTANRSGAAAWCVPKRTDRNKLWIEAYSKIDHMLHSPECFRRRTRTSFLTWSIHGRCIVKAAAPDPSTYTYTYTQAHTP